MAKTKMVYQTSPIGLFVGVSEADESPLEPGVFLIPGGCVEVPPPLIPDDKAAHWNGDAWQLVDYYQGLVVYSITTGVPLTINGMGPIPAGYTMLKPGPNQVWKDGKWVDDISAVIAKLYQEKLAEITSGCAKHIEGGFSSGALAEPYRYNSKLEDQVNLTGLMFSGLDSAYPCTDAQGVHQYREHTSTQLQQVNKDLVIFKQAALQHADKLKQDLFQALEDKQLKVMRAIHWSAPA